MPLDSLLFTILSRGCPALDDLLFACDLPKRRTAMWPSIFADDDCVFIREVEPAIASQPGMVLTLSIDCVHDTHGSNGHSTIASAVGKTSASYRSRARSPVVKPHQATAEMAALMSPAMTFLSNLSDTACGLLVSPHDGLGRSWPWSHQAWHVCQSE
jgi:hypothetical protein